MAKTRSRTTSGGKTKAETVVEESPTPKTGRKAKAAWKLMDRSTTTAATVAAPMVAAGAWRLVTGKKPPTSADNPELDLREAVTWAIVGGALVQGVKVLVRRKTAQYWVSSTGQLPPGMKSLADDEDMVEAKRSR